MVKYTAFMCVCNQLNDYGEWMEYAAEVISGVFLPRKLVTTTAVLNQIGAGYVIRLY